MQISAEFVTSAAGADDFPGDRLPEIALVGRSNVGKSSLINALVRRPVARTSAAPGKTRLANFYRVQRGSGPALYLVDSRHPGLESDLDAWAWAQSQPCPSGVIGTKVDKLTRAERTRNARQFQSLFEFPVPLVSADTGEGLDELWKMIARLPSQTAA